ncbi:hypothetical protein CesoFtcFv8_024493 [Champsocephalus esox]|uniref:Placenta-specific gene 8 protein n=1 Tax=Champsocephalus esox TaxID=159716 RepID=A0AAN8B741_9TELE|nr:hypothetical protein CesoFtcFv8_024493 [Champsocephalus esox]
MAVTNQPGRYAPSDFQTGLCDFCDDCGTCCYGLFCYMCLGCSIASDMDECCLCGLHMSIRSVYRTKYNINGSLGTLTAGRSKAFSKLIPSPGTL